MKIKFGDTRVVQRFVWLPTYLPIGTSAYFELRWFTNENIIQLYDDKFSDGWRDVAWEY